MLSQLKGHLPTCYLLLVEQANQCSNKSILFSHRINLSQRGKQDYRILKVIKYVWINILYSYKITLPSFLLCLNTMQFFTQYIHQLSISHSGKSHCVALTILGVHLNFLVLPFSQNMTSGFVSQTTLQMPLQLILLCDMYYVWYLVLFSHFNSVLDIYNISHLT